ncbi:sensor histidine kinase [Lignipirellula cremea]|uniref:histidine kinase n=1 Tax=Lignipirellula cremea TaxID=2528010 RepID=A0A518E0F4_9BACT|nr:HAMP domain-containing sensor histidine kinase [Lignipirellula cremea]QDU97565.1 Sensor protein ZraS [Lignipirellula cremea]
MRYPLRFQLLAPMAGVLLAAMAAVSVLNAWLSTRRQQQQLEGRLRNVAETLSQSNFPLGAVVLRQMQGLSGAEYAATSLEGELLAVSSEQLIPLPTGEPVQNWQSLQLTGPVELAGKEFFHMIVELDRRAVGGDRVLLHILYPRAEWRKARNEEIWPPLVIGVLALLALIGVTAVVAARATRPIGQLRSQVERIAEGDFAPMPTPVQNDEIRDLAEAVNRMAAILVRYEDEVRRKERLSALGQLGGSVAHQLRNAATGCRMALDLHGRDCPQGADEYLEVAVRQLTLMEKYLRRFLTLGQPASSNREQVDLGALVQTLLPLLSPAAQHVGVTLQAPAADGPVLVWGAADELEQMVINLALNGVEAAAQIRPGETVPVRQVTMTVTASDAHAVLRVADTGPGPGIDSQQMFEPLITEKREGAGLGLAIARMVAEAHAGRIAFSRRLGQTEFQVTIPLAQGPAPAAVPIL